MKEYVLKGSQEPASIERRAALLTKLFETADKKGEYLGGMRQRNLNFALIVFVGLFTLTAKLEADLYSVFVSGAGLGVMVAFCLLDRRLHTFIHGWRKTKTMFMEKINDVLNDPKCDVSYVRYLKAAEKTAEWGALQPIIFYLLVSATFVHFLYTIVSALWQ